MKHFLAATGVAVALGGCGDREMRTLGNLSVDDPFGSADAPSLEGVRIVAWNCNHKTILATGQTRPVQCEGLGTYTVAYRDSRWQYNVEVVDHRVHRIRASYSDFWP